MGKRREASKQTRVKGVREYCGAVLRDVMQEVKAKLTNKQTNNSISTNQEQKKISFSAIQSSSTGAGK